MIPVLEKFAHLWRMKDKLGNNSLRMTRCITGGRRNKIITLNTRPDYRGTFKNQILEFRLGNTKFLLLSLGGWQKWGKWVSYVTAGCSGAVLKQRAHAPPPRSSDYPAPISCWYLGMWTQATISFNFLRVIGNVRVFMKDKERGIDSGGQFLSKQEGTESKRRDWLLRERTFCTVTGRVKEKRIEGRGWRGRCGPNY